MMMIIIKIIIIIIKSALEQQRHLKDRLILKDIVWTSFPIFINTSTPVISTIDIWDQKIYFGISVVLGSTLTLRYREWTIIHIKTAYIMHLRKNYTCSITNTLCLQRRNKDITENTLLASYRGDNLCHSTDVVTNSFVGHFEETKKFCPSVKYKK